MKTGLHIHHASVALDCCVPPAANPRRTKAMLVFALAWLACVTGCSGEGTTEMPKESAGWLVGAYVDRVDDRSWGLLEIEKAEKGHSYVSKGERDIRAGVTVEPTRVTFTGWGFSPESGQLQHYRVISSWLCYTNDFGEPTGIPGQHEVEPIEGKIVKGKNLIDLGTLGMSPEQMDHLCGPGTKLTPSEAFGGDTRIRYRKDGYVLLCMFNANRLFAECFVRSDLAFATPADKMTWLLQNGTEWSEKQGGTYKGNGGSLNARRFELKDNNPSKGDGLEVTDDKLSPKGATTGRATPKGRYDKGDNISTGSSTNVAAVAPKSGSLTRSEWRQRLARFFTIPSGHQLLASQSKFFGLMGKPDKIQHEGRETYWYYKCSDGVVQLAFQLDPDMMGGQIVAEVSDE